MANILKEDYSVKLMKGNLTDMGSEGLQTKLSCPPFLLNL